MTNYLQQILTYFRNMTLNTMGVKRDIHQLLLDRDIESALDMLENRDDEVDLAIKEYNPQTHEIMKRPNKQRKKSDDFKTAKLARARQRYINEVELFFLLGNPIAWEKTEGDDEAYNEFQGFLKAQHFDSRIRQAKRLAGAETESAMVYHIYRNDDTGEREVRLNVLARSTGYRLRPMFDLMGNLTALAWGYVSKRGGRSVQHWDFQTADMMCYATKGNLGWEVEVYDNPTKKINAIYFRQKKAWDGAEKQLDREEMICSRRADSVDYFGDPIAAASADVINSMIDPDMPGKLIQMQGANSRFEYIAPPNGSQSMAEELADLRQGILYDTFTPDFDFNNMRGLGTLSGTAIRNSMILGYMKRDNLKEIYSEMVERFKNVTLAVMSFLDPAKAGKYDALTIDFSFGEPFVDDKQNKWGAIAQLYAAGLMSLETAVTMLGLVDAPQEEIDRLKKAAEEKAALAAPQPAPAAEAEPAPMEPTIEPTEPEGEGEGENTQEPIRAN